MVNEIDLTAKPIPEHQEKLPGLPVENGSVDGKPLNSSPRYDPIRRKLMISMG